MVIPLTQGKVALIDDQDWPLVAGIKWCATRQGGRWYAQGHLPGKRGRDHILGARVDMHRVLMCAPPGQEIDHINGDGLDNRRFANLRIATTSQNQWNRGRMRTNTSGYKGVTRSPAGRWRAGITAQGRQYFLGVFLTAADAALAYDAAARDLHGAFARLNFPEIAQLTPPRVPRNYNRNGRGFGVKECGEETGHA